MVLYWLILEYVMSYLLSFLTTIILVSGFSVLLGSPHISIFCIACFGAFSWSLLAWNKSSLLSTHVWS